MVVTANDAILNAAGLGTWFADASREQILDAAAQYASEMRDIASRATPGWKDPRFCWTLEAWLPLLPPSPRVIVCLRNPTEVVASTLRYYGLAGEEAGRAAMHTWRAECERILALVDAYHLDATAVEFEALHGRPADAVAPTERFVGRALDASFIRGDLRHHAAPVPDEARDLYDRVLALAAPNASARR
jgi:hypothetical protein